MRNEVETTTWEKYWLVTEFASILSTKMIQTSVDSTKSTELKQAMMEHMEHMENMKSSGDSMMGMNP